jgi:epoxyqueuosine reductase
MQSITSAAIKTVAREKGADIVGVASADRFGGEESGYRPGDLLPGAKSVVSVGIRQLRGYLERAPNTLFFAFGYRQKNDYINEILWALASKLDDEGYSALPVAAWGYGKLVGDSGTRMRGEFSHALAAKNAGLGEMGLNGMFLSSEYGPRVHLGSVITDAPLKADSLFKEQLCDRKGCRQCVVSCPAHAIDSDGRLDAVGCLVALDKLHSGYDETKKQLLAQQSKEGLLKRAAKVTGYSEFWGTAFCGLACVNACPVGKKELI